MQIIQGPAAACLGDRFTPTPNALHALADTPREFQLMAALLSYRWRSTSPIIPSVETLASQVGCSHRTIRRTVAALEARGLLKRVERRAEDDRQMSNEYALRGGLLAAVTRMEATAGRRAEQPWPGRRPPVAGERIQPNDKKLMQKSQPGYGRHKGADPYTGGALGVYIRS